MLDARCKGQARRARSTDEHEALTSTTSTTSTTTLTTAWSVAMPAAVSSRGDRLCASVPRRLSARSPLHVRRTFVALRLSEGTGVGREPPPTHTARPPGKGPPSRSGSKHSETSPLIECSPTTSSTPSIAGTLVRSSGHFHQVTCAYTRRQKHVVSTTAPPLTPHSPVLAGPPPSDVPALDADLGIVAEPGGGVLFDHHPPGPAPRQLPDRRRPHRRHRALHRRLERPLPAVHLDQRPRHRHRQGHRPSPPE